MKKIKTVKESYVPSSESYRKDVEAMNNKNRIDMYRDKKASQEALQPAWWTYEDNDQLWIDSHAK